MAAIAAPVVFDGLVPGFSARDAGFDVLFLQGVPEAVGIIAPVGEEHGVHAAFRAGDQAVRIPFLTRRLETVRCGFREVASTLTILHSETFGTAKPSCIRRKTPFSPQRL